jgi:hypothetical protein
MDIKIFNSLPLRLKQLYKDVKHFKSALKEYERVSLILYCLHSFVLMLFTLT